MQPAACENFDILQICFRLREKDVKRDDEFKNDDSSKISRIVDACISFDLLTTKLSMPVHLNIDADRITSRNPSTKGKIFGIPKIREELMNAKTVSILYLKHDSPILVLNFKV